MVVAFGLFDTVFGLFWLVVWVASFWCFVLLVIAWGSGFLICVGWCNIDSSCVLVGFPGSGVLGGFWFVGFVWCDGALWSGFRGLVV